MNSLASFFEENFTGVRQVQSREIQKSGRISLVSNLKLGSHLGNGVRA
jgi:hypothetical protein